jgi:acyl-CoA reductase-like NAD-dependent aldehyde dehydrogenase
MGFPIPPEKIEFRHYINGEFCESSDKGSFELKSPYSHEKIADMCEASVDDTDRAVAAAKAAFPAWAAQSPAERGALLKQLAARIRTIHNELAQLNAMDMGRPVCGRRFVDAFGANSYHRSLHISTQSPPPCSSRTTQRLAMRPRERPA